MNHNQKTGIEGEAAAENFYRQLGFTTLAKNYRVREGELDLVVQRAGLLLFVEVKARAENWEQHAWAPGWQGKKRKLHAAIRRFQLEHKELIFSESRLEVIFITQGRVAARFERI